MNLNAGAGIPLSRSKQLKAATHAKHDRLDKGIMAHAPFASRSRYAKFLRVQYLFHRDIDSLFHHKALDALLPDLVGRRRLGLIEADLADLEVEKPVGDSEAVFAEGVQFDLPTALGWLYVAEGSNLGAAFLLKEATKLGLSEDFGAQHLAGAPGGRGLHWRKFTQALDGLELTPAEDERVCAGGLAAFARVWNLVGHEFDG